MTLTGAVVVHSVVSDSLRPQGLQLAKLPCPSPTPGACSNSCPWSRWCPWSPSHPLSVTHFSSCYQSFPEQGFFFFFPISHFFTLGGQSIGASASTPVLPMYIQGWFPLGLTGLISLLSKGLSSLLRHHGLKVSVLRCSAFFIVQLSHLYRKINHNYSWQTRTCAPLIDHASDFGLHPKNNVIQGLSLVMGMRAAPWKDLPGYTVRTGMVIVSLNTQSPS